MDASHADDLARAASFSGMPTQSPSSGLPVLSSPRTGAHSPERSTCANAGEAVVKNTASNTRRSRPCITPMAVSGRAIFSARFATIKVGSSIGMRRWLPREAGPTNKILLTKPRGGVSLVRSILPSHGYSRTRPPGERQRFAGDHADRAAADPRLHAVHVVPDHGRLRRAGDGLRGAGAH